MTFKFISLNIWEGGRLLNNALDFLKSENPDIIALQEAYDQTDPQLESRFRTLDILKKELGLAHSSFAPAFGMNIDNKIIDTGNAILSRFPITSPETLFYDIPYRVIAIDHVDYSLVPRNLQQVKLQIGEHVITILHTQGVWGTDDNDNPRRLAMTDTIVRRIKGMQNVIVAGDLNVDQDSHAIQMIENELKNVFKNGLQSSFNPKHKRDGNFHNSVVDFIFASPSIQIVDHYCPQVDISDHLPLVSVFEIV